MWLRLRASVLTHVASQQSSKCLHNASCCWQTSKLHWRDAKCLCETWEQCWKSLLICSLQKCIETDQAKCPPAGCTHQINLIQILRKDFCVSNGSLRAWNPANGVCPSLCHADVISCPNWSKLDSTYLHARRSFYIKKRRSGLPVEDLALPARCGGLGLLRSCRFGINSIGLRSDLWPSCVFWICLRRHAKAIVLLCGVLRRVKRGVSRLMTLVTTCSAFARELSGAHQCRVQV